MGYTRKFVWGEDKEFGGEGWIPEGMPDFNAGVGMTMAHDVLEHFSADDASIEAEFMAFGSTLYIRAEGSYWANTNSYIVDPAHHMSSDATRFIMDTLYRGQCIRSPGRTITLETVDGYESELVIKAFRENCLQQFRNGYDTQERYEHRRGFRQALENAIGWMRRGYRKARRRWMPHSPYEMTSFFIQTEKQLDKLANHGEYGDTLVVTVDPKKLKVNTRIKGGYDPDDY